MCHTVIDKIRAEPQEYNILMKAVHTIDFLTFFSFTMRSTETDITGHLYSVKPSEGAITDK